MWIKVKDLSPFIKKALREIGYGSHDIKIEGAEEIKYSTPGDHSRNVYVFFDLEKQESEIVYGEYYDSLLAGTSKLDFHGDSKMRPGILVFKGSSWGKQVFGCLLAHRDNLQGMIGEKPILTEEEIEALRDVKNNKGDEWYAKYRPNHPLIKILAEKGLVKINRKSVVLTNAGRNAL